MIWGDLKRLIRINRNFMFPGPLAAEFIAVNYVNPLIL
jgi:hypothetical protein